MAQVYIVMGSASDIDTLKASGMAKILDEIGVSYDISVCSAHRNLPDLEKFAEQAVASGGQVFIGIAGMAAALPGALAGCTGMQKPIIGVPLDEHGVDSCVYMPPGVPVLTSGVGRAGLTNAAVAACQILAAGDATVAASLKAYVTKNNRQPRYNISLAD